jgi:hypothetical protein
MWLYVAQYDLILSQPVLFNNIAWSTEQVTAQTLDRAEALELRVAILTSWYDVDAAADLDRLRAELDKLPPEVLRHSRHFFDRYTCTQGL